MEHTHKEVRSWEAFSPVFWQLLVAGWEKITTLVSPSHLDFPGACKGATSQSCFACLWRKLFPDVDIMKTIIPARIMSADFSF